MTEVWNTAWTFYRADFNGDGLSELLLHDPLNGAYVIAKNNGQGFGYSSGT